jgi:predicted GNAT family acetyltransferase
MTAVVHVPARHRFEAALPVGTAVLTYVLAGDVVVMDHTRVPPAARGQGIAAALVETALRWARDEGFAVVPQCSYVATWLRDNPDAVDVEVRAA